MFAMHSSGAPSKARRLLGPTLVLAWGVGTSASVCAAPPRLVVPHDPATVLERLPRGYAALMPSRQRIDPMTEAEALLSTAASTGDARLAARADLLLARQPDGAASNRVLLARAFSAQHRHDFATAVAMLDTLIARDARAGDARLARAQIETLRGELLRARSDCAVLALGVDSGRGLLCVATLALRRGDVASAADVLDRWLAQSPAADPARRYALVMRGEVASRARSTDAHDWFEAALRISPRDVRTLAAYARHLRSMGRHREVVALLAHAPDHDGLALQRALAAHALRLRSTKSLTAVQTRRYALARALGTTPELRDEAELHLTLQGDPQRALALATLNFASQRDAEDVDILRRSALAVGDTIALERLDRWLAARSLPITAGPGTPR